MLFGRLFDRKPKASDDPTSGSDTPNTANKLRRNRTVSVSTDIAKETATPGVRKRLSIAVPRSKPTPDELTKSAPASSPRHRTAKARRATSAAEAQADPARPGPQRPRSPFLVPRRSAEAAPASPSASSTRTRGSLRTEPARGAGEPRPRIRRGSSAPPSVAGVVRAELDADGLAIRDAHALRAEPVLVVPREHVAEFCAEVLVWEEAGADAEPAVLTAEPEPLPDGTAPGEPDEPARPAAALVPLSAPPTLTLAGAPKKSLAARLHVRRRAQSLMYVLCDMQAPLKTWY